MPRVNLYFRGPDGSAHYVRPVRSIEAVMRRKFWFIGPWEWGVVVEFEDYSTLWFPCSSEEAADDACDMLIRQLIPEEAFCEV